MQEIILGHKIIFR